MTVSKVEVVVLGLLADEPMHGYDLLERFRARSMGFWVEVGKASVYQVLKRLEREGSIAGKAQEGTEGPDRRVYRITSGGQATAQRRSRRAVGSAGAVRDRCGRGDGVRAPGSAGRGAQGRRRAGALGARPARRGAHGARSHARPTRDPGGRSPPPCSTSRRRWPRPSSRGSRPTGRRVTEGRQVRRTARRRPETRRTMETTMEAAFFDLDKTIISRSSSLALSRPLYRAGMVSRGPARCAARTPSSSTCSSGPTSRRWSASRKACWPSPRGGTAPRSKTWCATCSST